MLNPGTILDEKYRLERPIGQCGMGTVWLAQHLGWQAPVAIKLVNLELLKKRQCEFSRSWGRVPLAQSLF
jgi:serine/threonine protein kinase